MLSNRPAVRDVAGAKARVTLAATASLVVLAVAMAAFRAASSEQSSAAAGRLPRLRPDYCNVVVPPNIAPPNFRIAERGRRYRLTISADGETDFAWSGRSGKVRIPRDCWRRLVEAARGRAMRLTVSVLGDEGTWRRYDPASIAVAEEPVDSHLVYRSVPPLYNYYSHMAIRQYDLERAVESVVWDNDSFEGCMNCHSFLHNDPRTFSLQMRSGLVARGHGMIVSRDCDLSKVNTSTSRSLGLAAFTSWHPSGKLVAFSMNRVRQFFHTHRSEVRDVVDLDSDLAIYVFASQSVQSCQAIADHDFLETWPAWSADGRTLYFSRTRCLWEDRHRVPPPNWRKVRYDLVSIGFDPDTLQWGDLEPIVSSAETGMSINEPRPSPDGRLLAFAMCDYSTFPTFRPNSDLYLMDLQTGERRRLVGSSDSAESWPSWSSNGRWLAFSSKRGTDIFGRPYICYVDAEGRDHKPFLMPQRDPCFYESDYRLYQVPELVAGPVAVTGEQLDAVVRTGRWQGSTLAVTGATPRSGGPH